MTVAPIYPVGAPTAVEQTWPLPGNTLLPATSGPSFGNMLLDGVNAVSDKAASADKMVRAFALDDSIPVHQVTFALEQARLSLELMLQVRSRIVEGYQQLMGMQL
jgi:flagellar hook-basal body complex protein FliE